MAHDRLVKGSLLRLRAMQEVAEFRGYAEDCRRIARSTTDPEHKRRLLEMATVWDLLANEREGRIDAANRPASDRR